ncbi:MAG: hypothetical protein Q8877_02785 [Sweet potato little leaf phytoplasma]|nr:hypothetical protein [Sweet potato little leaf phytoplasma]
MEETGFMKGNFTFRYLGLPMTSTKWKKTDCQLLVDKVTARINTWTSRHLSYQGKCQLNNSVLLALHSYWASAFILPKATIRQIERKCKDFLWGNNQASVAWSTICKHRKYGGLGFKSPWLWNTAAVGKQV